MKKIIVLCLLIYKSLLFAGGIVPPPDLLFVGDGSGQCVYTSIQEAIDDATPNSEIRVTKDAGTYFENIEIEKSIILKGGYSSCGLAQLDSRDVNNKSIIDGGLGGTVMTFGGENLTLHMSGFQLTNGQQVGINPAGGLTLYGDNNVYHLDYMQFFSNHGYFGGGIYLGGDSVLNLKHTDISFNQAESGGGIYCAQAAKVNYMVGSEITLNNAVDGGGIYADECQVELKSGSNNLLGYSLDGVTLNIASDFGGGIYLNNSVLRFLPDYENDQYLATNVAMNTANNDGDQNGDGGGIFAVDSEVDVAFAVFLQQSSS